MRLLAVSQDPVSAGGNHLAEASIVPLPLSQSHQPPRNGASSSFYYMHLGSMKSYI